MKQNQNLSLFDLLDREDEKITPGSCKHPRDKEEKTYTIWPGENFERITMTCRICGRIRGYSYGT